MAKEPWGHRAPSEQAGPGFRSGIAVSSLTRIRDGGDSPFGGAKDPQRRSELAEATAPLHARLDATEAREWKYLGVYKPATRYSPSSLCTFDGSLWNL